MSSCHEIHDMKEDAKERNVRMLGLSILFAIMASVAVAASFFIYPSFWQLPPYRQRRIEKEFGGDDTGLSLYISNRGARHALIQFGLLMATGVAFSTLVEKLTRKRMTEQGKAESNNMSAFT